MEDSQERFLHAGRQVEMRFLPSCHKSPNSMLRQRLVLDIRTTIIFQHSFPVDGLVTHIHCSYQPVRRVASPGIFQDWPTTRLGTHIRIKYPQAVVTSRQHDNIIILTRLDQNSYRIRRWINQDMGCWVWLSRRNLHRTRLGSH